MNHAFTLYSQRFHAGPARLHCPVPNALSLAIVIPACNEPSLFHSLDALWQCQRPAGAVEILVVLNHPVNASTAVRVQNQLLRDLWPSWQSRHYDDRFQAHLIDATELPARHAGVGLARKIGMDEALRRFNAAGNLDQGVIACFDADCECDGNYLTALEDHFRAHPETPGCAVYFEHPLEGGLDARCYEAAAAYELHLRYYVQAMRFAGLPYGYHSVGSSMAVRPAAYMKQGGMNRRQAGEDFYFLHKIIQLGRFTELNATRVIPSPRVSDRVPFGTGRAVGQFLETGRLASYPFQAFMDLKHLTDWIRGVGVLDRELPDRWPAAVGAFLETARAAEAWREICRNAATPEAMRKRFFRWFDAFRTMKFIHFARDEFYGAPEPASAAADLASQGLRAKTAPPGGADCAAWLRWFRVLDRGQANGAGCWQDGRTPTG